MKTTIEIELDIDPDELAKIFEMGKFFNFISSLFKRWGFNLKVRGLKPGCPKEDTFINSYPTGGLNKMPTWVPED